MGYNVAELVEKLLNLSFSEDEEVANIAKTDSCTNDAIQVVAGCTLGKDNLFINKWGKMPIHSTIVKLENLSELLEILKCCQLI